MPIQMKATEQYFPEALLKMLYKIALSLWMKSYGVTIQMKPLQKHFCEVPFISRLLQNEISCRFVFVFFFFNSVYKSSLTFQAVVVSCSCNWTILKFAV